MKLSNLPPGTTDNDIEEAANGPAQAGLQGETMSETTTPIESKILAVVPSQYGTTAYFAAREPAEAWAMETAGPETKWSVIETLLADGIVGAIREEHNLVSIWQAFVPRNPDAESKPEFFEKLTARQLYGNLRACAPASFQGCMDAMSDNDADLASQCATYRQYAEGAEEAANNAISCLARFALPLAEATFIANGGAPDVNCVGFTQSLLLAFSGIDDVWLMEIMPLIERQLSEAEIQFEAKDRCEGSFSTITGDPRRVANAYAQGLTLFAVEMETTVKLINATILLAKAAGCDKDLAWTETEQ